MIVISGPSASGKTEVAKLLAAKFGFTKVITTTTRSMRSHEVNGVDYFFISKEEFEKKIKNDDFVEYMSYNGNLYGSTKDQMGRHRIIVCDLNGLKSYIALGNKHVVTFFLVSDEKTRYERMLSRGDAKKEASSRIKTDKKVFSIDEIEGVNFFIDNENKTLEDLAEEINKDYKDFVKVLKDNGYRQKPSTGCQWFGGKIANHQPEIQIDTYGGKYIARIWMCFECDNRDDVEELDVLQLGHILNNALLGSHHLCHHIHIF